MSESPSKQTETLKKLYVTLKNTQAKLDELERAKNEPIAIVGMAGRFPGGADSLDQYWALLQGGVDATKEVPADRWNARDFYDPDPETPGKMYSMRGGFLEGDVFAFDPPFFGLTPKEVTGMDPQHRLLLEVSWEALENAGYNVQALKGSKTGVFVGLAGFDYATAHIHSGDLTKVDAYSVTGIALSTAPGRISYLFGFEGPSLAVDTACSSALVAIHLACQSLRSGESRLALAGGVNLILTPEIHVGFSRMKGISHDGHCKVFDAAADGYSRGEGCGVLVLKRYADAVKDGDSILALIAGSAINHDGRSNGFTAPNGRAQQGVIREALQNAGVTPSVIDYVEAHGTGTPLGDPIEIDSLAAVYGHERKREQALRVGSVKANLGHLEAAAGSAGIIKAILQLRHQALCPQIHFKTPSPHIPWSEIPIEVTQTLTPWPSKPEGRFAAVSGFGFSGTNAHVILKEAPPQAVQTEGAAKDRPMHLLALSARNEESLKAVAERYVDFLQKEANSPGARVGDICYSTIATRPQLPQRLAILGKTKQEMAEKLEKWRRQEDLAGAWPGSVSRERPRKLAFLFSGQGSQYKHMGTELLETQPAFRTALERCHEILKSQMEFGLMDLVFNDQVPEQALHQTIHTQPVIFSFGYAIAKMWESWGVVPEAVLGHSIGELAAACFAGVFELEDALKLVVARGRLIQNATSSGAMGAVVANAKAVSEAIVRFGGAVSIAAINAPENIVISGDHEAVTRVLDYFREQNVPSRALRISHAIHSPLMEPILGEFEAVASQLKFSSPRIPIISTVTGEPAGNAILRPQYWRRQIREAVNFKGAIEHLHQNEFDAYIEAGATSTLTSLGMQCLPNTKNLWLSSMGVNNSMFNMRPQRLKGRSDWETLLESLGQLFVNGVEVKWEEVEKSFGWRKVGLPNYPFQRKHYRMQPTTEHRVATAVYAPSCIRTDTIQVPPLPAPGEPNHQQAATPSTATMDREEVTNELKKMLHRISELEIAAIDGQAKLLELGIDSLMVTRFREAIRNKFGVAMEISWFFTKTETLAKIAEYIAANAPAPTVATESVARNGNGNGASAELLSTHNHHSPAAATAAPVIPSGASEIERIMAQQLQTMSRLMESQLEVLRQTKASHAPAIQNGIAHTNGAHPSKSVTSSARRKLINVRSVKFNEDPLTPQQQEFVSSLIARYNRKTAGSKAYAQENRGHLADWINSLGFRKTLKEVMYPIVSERSEGARIWDIDGNEYIDLAIGYGVNFFGNRFPAVAQAVAEQLARGYDLGPQSATAAEAARLICELTGVERVAFSNTGSEAVMIALRLARTVTGKSKVVLFSGSYHGISDGVLATPTEDGGVMPSAPGIPDSMVENVIVLDYGTPDSLEAIRQHADELAAVLVEPVQSRRPGFHPKTFLQKLRELTAERGIVMIFDEMITGFRIMPGGAQAWFGIQADLVTYGKIVGGGLPIGVIAGKAQFMGPVDGGFWQFGDDSFPSREMTFFAGTFCKHPLSMAAAKAALTYIKQQGVRLYEEVNRRAAGFVARLNDFFRAENVPIKVEHFGPLFRFESFGKYHLLRQPLEMDLLFYLLLEKGIYTWERRICSLSTAHTDADVDEIVARVKESITALRAGGFTFEASSSANESANVVPTRSITCPASSPQKRLYVLDQLEGQSSSYLMSAAFVIEGEPDAAALNRSLVALIERHESLRTSFGWQGDVLIQQIESPVDFQMERIDGQGRGTEEILSAFLSRFDLTKAPLFRAGLVKLAERRHLLVLASHHIVIDGLSWNIFVQELIQLYRGQSLPALRHQYRDYCEWLAQYYQSQEFKGHEAYWLKTFAGDIPVLNLPTDFPRPSQRTSQGDVVHFTIPKSVVDPLKTAARKTGSTLYMMLLGAYQLLLHRLTGQQDIIVGSPSQGRPPEGYEDVVGMFANTLAVRHRMDGTVSVAELLSSLRTKLAEIYDHQNYPFELLIERLGLKRDLSRNAVVDTMLVFERGDDRVVELPGLKLTPHPIRKAASMFDLSLEIVEQRGALLIAMEFSTELFRKETIVRWADYFERILHHLPSSLETPLGKFPILSDHEKQKLILEWSDGGLAAVAKEETVLTYFEAQAKKNPARAAVVCGEETLDYAGLSLQSASFADHLKKLGIAPKARIAICCERSVEAVVGILGILKAGAAYVPLDPGYPRERMVHILKDCGALFVVTQRRLLPLFENMPVQAVVLDGEWRSEGATKHGASPSVRASDQVQYDDLAYCIYTSGSTGAPKGVAVNHGNLTYSTVARRAFYPESPSALLLVPTFAFDTSVAGIFWTLIEGGTLVIPRQGEQSDVVHLAELIRQHKVSHWLSVPSLYQLLLSETETSHFSSLRAAIVAGENCPKALVYRHRESLPGVPLYNEYGPTEATVWCTAERVDKYDLDSIASVPIGRAIANTRVYVLTEQLELAPMGVPGELCVAGYGVAQGYLNQPELTKKKFVPNPFADGPYSTLYRTGDLAVRRDDGRLDFLGRLDNQVKIRGYRIELEEIETVLLECPEVAGGAIVVQNASDGSTFLVAYAVPKKAGADKESIRQAVLGHLKAKLPDYMAPSVLMLLDQLPVTTNGKVDKRALPVPVMEARARSAGQDTPRNNVERCLVEVWQDVLRKPSIGIHDSYLDLGGDSIKAIQIAARLRQHQLTLRIPDIFRFPSIAELAPHLESKVRATDQSAALGEAKLTPIQRWFFEAKFRHPHQFNQAARLSISGRLNIKALERAFVAVRNHHDLLRATFAKAEAEKVFSVAADEGAWSLQEIDLRNHSNPEEALHNFAEKLQSSLNIGKGPLMAAAAFHLPQADIVVIAIHHLAVDIVSWRILMEDLETAYRQADKGTEIRLPLKTDSFARWSEQLQKAVRDGYFDKQSTYWSVAHVGTQAVHGLPVLRNEPEANLVRHTTRCSITLDGEVTGKLAEANRAYNTEVRELILSALIRVLIDWTGRKDQVIEMESHGRASLAGVDLDLSRTVGWFTSLYPVRFDLADSLDLGNQIKQVKETMRRVPDQGIGYGVLRYLTPDSDLAKSRLSPSAVTFNFFGDTTETRSGEVFHRVEEFRSGGLHPNEQRTSLLEIEAMLHHSQLTVAINFSAVQFERAEVERRLGRFERELRAVIEHCAAKEGSEVTLSDLTYKNLGVGEIDELLEDA